MLKVTELGNGTTTFNKILLEQWFWLHWTSCYFCNGKRKWVYVHKAGNHREHASSYFWGISYITRVKTYISTNMVEVGSCIGLSHNFLWDRNKGHLFLDLELKLKTYRLSCFRVKWDFQSTNSKKSLSRIYLLLLQMDRSHLYLARYGVLFLQSPSLFWPELRIMGNSPKIRYFGSNGESFSSWSVLPEKLDWNFGKDKFSNKMPVAIYFYWVVQSIALGW